MNELELKITQFVIFFAPFNDSDNETNTNIFLNHFHAIIFILHVFIIFTPLSLCSFLFFSQYAGSMENFPTRAIKGSSDFIGLRGDGIENNHWFNMQWLYIEFRIWRIHAVSIHDCVMRFQRIINNCLSMGQANEW